MDNISYQKFKNSQQFEPGHPGSYREVDQVGLRLALMLLEGSVVTTTGWSSLDNRPKPTTI